MRHSTDARPYIISSSAAVLEFVTPDSRVRVVLSLRSGLVLSLVVCGEVGPSTASLANHAPVYCGCPAKTNGCDLVSRVRLDQSANPDVVWLGLVPRVREVIMETWNLRKSQHPSSTRSWSRAGRLWDHHSNLTSTLRSRFVLTASVARHHHGHVDNLVTRTAPVEYLARLGSVTVLVTESHGYQVGSSCFDLSTA